MAIKKLNKMKLKIFKNHLESLVQQQSELNKELVDISQREYGDSRSILQSLNNINNQINDCLQLIVNENSESNG